MENEIEATEPETFLLTEIAYHKQEGRPDVFVGNKGDRILRQVAINIGLIKGEKTEKPLVSSKALSPDDVENKAIKMAKGKSGKTNTPKE